VIDLIDRQDLLQNALRHGESLEYVRFARTCGGGKSQSRSLFGKLAAVLRSSEDSLPAQRAALQLMRGWKEPSFQGVKTGELTKLIDLLFCEKGQLLPETVFAGYSQANLLGYLEICRRCFMVAQSEMGRPLEAPATVYRPAPPPELDVPAWLRNPPITIQFALAQGNQECAQYVLSHGKEYPQMQKVARAILGGK